FCSSYHADREAFFDALARFTAATRRSVQHHSFAVDPEADLTVSIAEFPAKRPERVYVVSCGIHGVEGYAGSAIIRALLESVLPQLNAEDTGLLVVHALNPYGFHHFVRVNRNNVDLNRNCAAPGDSLFATSNPE